MGLDVLGRLLESSSEYQRLLESMHKTRARVRLQVMAEAAPFVLSALWRGLGLPVLVIAPKPEDARRLHEQLVIWAGEENVLHFPETETMPFERIVSDVDTTQERLRTLYRLIEADGVPSLVVASATAVAQKTIDRGSFESAIHTLHRGQSTQVGGTLDLWRRMGYRTEPSVEGPGLVSRRGGIQDIFSLQAQAPSRIELWGDEIDSIRLFDPVTQRSTDEVDSVTVIPAQETLPGLSESADPESLIGSIDMSNCTAVVRERLSEELDLLLSGHEVDDLNFYSGLFNSGGLLDYFPPEGVLVMLRPYEIREAAGAADERSHQLRRTKEQRGELPRGFPSSHLLWSEVEEKTGDISRSLDITPWGAAELTHKDTVVLPFNSPSGYLGRPDGFVDEAHELAREGHRVVAVTSAPKRLAEILDEKGIRADLPDPLEEAPSPGSITVLQTRGAALSEGWVLTINGRKLVVLSDLEIFGVAKQRRPTRRRVTRRDSMLSELKPGDYVVHVEHGIGRFKGTGRTPRDEGDREYLILEYAAGDQLYVPTDHLDRVSPYIAAMDRPPTLTRLGSQEWNRTKERVQRSTQEMAAELLSLYAARELAEGHSFDSDVAWQVELEDAFPHEETPDQRDTIADIKADMERSRPMDRLICGDVGYGKTEVALRAAFKATVEGKQVAVLVPTTVLAQQHYVTFSQRLKAYPVTIEVLSRFRTDQEQREIVEGLATGKVDICIGTHRLVQKDVSFKNLGLAIIDEEQRFGVAHKERLKQMRHEVDVLTLTATPIPRTLHLSLSGIRDMSMIETPPEERLPIKTYVSEFSDELIREAIRREIDRQGQVFFLHNRVHNIDYMAGYVNMLVPEAKVAVAHGQMPEDQLEETMLDFAEGKTDVLVCTTIIESGLDIPNVNTLIVDRANTFGLAQLYQLRGRVGRGARRAYAYLLIPPSKSLTEAAEKRLKTMLAATELGAGFQIAMRDLEIRGAGNVLGAAQSGHIHAVGFDLYTRMVGEAVEALRAQRAGSDGKSAVDGDPEDGPDIGANSGSGPEPPPSVDLGIPANIPEDYVADLTTRLGIYRRLAGLTESSELHTLQDELVDRLGPLPWQVQNLLYMARLKLRATAAGAQSITREGEKIVVRLRDQTGGARQALQRHLGRQAVVGNAQIRLDLDKLGDRWEGPLEEMVVKLASFKERLEAELGVAMQGLESTKQPVQ